MADSNPVRSSVMLLLLLAGCVGNDPAPAVDRTSDTAGEPSVEPGTSENAPSGEGPPGDENITRFTWSSGLLNRTALQATWSSGTCDVIGRIASVAAPGDEPYHGHILQAGSSASWASSVNSGIAGFHALGFSSGAYATDSLRAYQGYPYRIDASTGATLTIFSHRPGPWGSYDHGFEIDIDCDAPLRDLRFAAGGYRVLHQETVMQGTGVYAVSTSASVDDSWSTELSDTSWIFAGVPANWQGSLEIRDDSTRSWTLGPKVAESWTTQAGRLDAALYHVNPGQGGMVVIAAGLAPIEHPQLLN